MTTIEEDYVSFEVAKLLKEKGFNYPCRVVYSPKGIVKHYLKEEIYAHHLKGHKKLCPTLQMAMKWLREVHNIDIFPWKIGKGIYSCAIFNSNTGQDLSSDKNFPSEKYEETAEAAIKYCLENLI